MKLTTRQAFDKFIRNISPTEAQREQAIRNCQRARSYLETVFSSSSVMPLDRTLVIGSAARNTIIAPAQGVDLMAQFANSDGVLGKYRHDSRLFFQHIARALGAETAIAKMRQGQAIRLFYADGPVIDIAPVFKYRDAGYMLPTSDGGWIIIDPEAQDRWFAERCEIAGKNLRLAVRLARHWNRVHRSRFQPYHLEVLTTNTFESIGSNWPDSLAKLFSWAPESIRMRDPAGHLGRLDYYLSEGALRAIRSRFADAANRANQALLAEANSDHATAKGLWRIELGEEFPID
jgi:Second Messenger Oligonucleotide or Dinucleotide Synthetase domain